MNKLAKTTLLAAASVALFSQAARGALSDTANPGDLILGFTASSGNDYIVDAGAVSLTPGAHTDLSSFVSGSSVLMVQSSGIVGVNAGAVSSSFGFTPTLVYTTTAHGAAHPNLPANGGFVSAAAGIVGGLSEGVQPSNGSASWQSTIAKDANTAGTANPGNFVTQLGGQVAGVNPLHTFGSSKILLEDVWNETLTSGGAVQAWQLLGTLTFDFTGSSPSVSFDAVTPVPEPATYGMVAGLGLLALSLRRQLCHRTA